MSANNKKCSGLSGSELQRWLVVSGSGKFAFSASVEINRFAARVDCSVFDFETKEKLQCTETKIFKSGRKEYFSKYEKGELSYRSKYCGLDVQSDDNVMNIYCKLSRCFFHTESEIDVRLFGETSDLHNEESFLFLKAEGSVKIKGRAYSFSPDGDFCIYECFEKKASRNSGLKETGCGYSNSLPFCYKLDDSENSENTVIINGKTMKLGKVSFKAPEGSFMKEWSVVDENACLKLTFTPFFNDHTESRYPFSEKAEKLFGFVSGEFISENGEKIIIEKAIGYHEIFH